MSDHAPGRPGAAAALTETPGRRQRVQFWCLGIAGLLLNAGIVYFAVSLLSAPTAAQPTSRGRIVVPHEQEADLWPAYRRWIVQEDGRHKPFDTFCRESVRTITGREQFEAVRSATTGRVVVAGHDPVAVVVSWMLLPGLEERTDRLPLPESDWEHHPFLLCRNQELRRLIYDEDRPGQHVEPAVVRDSQAFAETCGRGARRLAEDRKAPLPPLERDALEVQSRLSLYDLIRRGGAEENGEEGAGRPAGPRFVALDRSGKARFSLRSLRAYASPAGEAKWDAALRRRRLDDPTSYEGQQPQPYPAPEVAAVVDAYRALGSAYRSGDGSRFAAAGEEFFAVVERVNGQFTVSSDAIDPEMELWFNRTSPFQKAWAFSLLSALLLGGALASGRWPGVSRTLHAIGLLACAVSLAWAGAGFYCRVSISGRPPVSNMYESIVWVASVTAAFGLLLELIDRRGVAALASALASTLGFVLADQLPTTFSPSIQPLQAVLRSNFWLVVHVLTIVSSYAPLALAWALGNITLALILYAPRRRDLIHALSQLSYRCIQAGVLLLFAGTMLGGFWAAESWGRFWGWDPKEVWALIALLCYLIPLHARHVGWIKDFGLAACSVVCFSSVVMAWYGVNYVLGAGLHSYGFGSGEHSAIYLAGLVNISLVVHAAMRSMAGRTTSDRCRAPSFAHGLPPSTSSPPALPAVVPDRV